MIKEILLFSPGDSNDPKLWSNVPCLYGRTLEKKGFVVHRVNIGNSFLGKIYNHLCFWYQNITKIKVTIPWTQTIFFNYLAKRIVNKAIKRYKTVDLCIFMGNNGVANFKDDKPCIIFCESEFGNLIRRTENREPNKIETRCVNRTKLALEKANLVTILFPQDMQSMKNLSPHINVCYGKSNVLNLFYDKELDEETILQNKANSNIILYVGGRHYREGAEMTIKAFDILKEKDTKLELHIIGMTQDDFYNIPEGVVCHGYLYKDNPLHNSEYYSLFLNAKVYVNPTPRWGAYSSCIESMYFYNPIIVHPYNHFVGEFGKNIDFGCYNESFTPNGVAKSISEVIYSNNYTNMAKQAHIQVKDYTWDNYIDWTMSELEKTLKKF